MSTHHHIESEKKPSYITETLHVLGSTRVRYADKLVGKHVGFVGCEKRGQARCHTI